MITEFTPLTALGGGALIGAAAALYWLFNGRIAGISGILSRLFSPIGDGENMQRVCFVLGLIAAPLALKAAAGTSVPIAIAASSPVLAIAGLLTGIGTVVGNGCTSGHGVCGIARLSRRSLAATLTFMAAAIITVFIARHHF